MKAVVQPPFGQSGAQAAAAPGGLPIPLKLQDHKSYRACIAFRFRSCVGGIRGCGLVKLTAEKSGFTDTVPRAIERQSARAHRCAPALRHDHPLAGARGCTLRPARAAARRRRAPSFPPSSLCPEISGLAPTWGSASSGPDRLWSAHGARGLAPKHEFEAGRRLEGELGYGLGPFGDRFTGTPKHRLRALG